MTARHAAQRQFKAEVTPHASWIYRFLLVICRLIAWSLGFHLELQGEENLPRTADGKLAGSWIAAGLPHRTWIEPFVVVMLMPREPRIVFLADGVTVSRSRLRRLIFRLVGGVTPIWPGSGSQAFDRHAAAAVLATQSGAVFGLFPEVGAASPFDRARRLSAGIGYFTLRTEAPVVPLVLGGTGELYRGRRIVMRVLPAMTTRDLAGLAPDAPLPAPGSAEERALAHTIRDALQERVAPAVAELNALTEPPPGTKKRWRWLTNALH